ncbi:MAG: sugar ABC transporter substrate-binding protein [Anaerolineae bacterium]|nr:sugar ABC transporter substrate-binding protein [Anaerolineae bacterium]
MQRKMSRREMLKATAAGAAGLASGLSAATVLASDAASGFAAPPLQDAVTIRFQESEQEYADVVAAYKEVAPNVNIEFVNITGVDHAEIASKILAQLAAGQPVDIGYAATEATQLYAGEGLALPLKNRVMDSQADLAEYFSDVSPVLVETDLYQDDLYQLPRDFNAANMYFNTALLTEAGLEVPGEEWTKDDFVEYAKAMTGIGGGDSFGYGWTNRLWGSWTPWFFVNDTNLLAEERAPGGEWLWGTFYKDDPNAAGRGGGWLWPAPQANNPAMVEALEFVVSLTEQGLTPVVELGGGATLQGFFTSGKLGMTPAGGFWSGGLTNAGMEKGGFDVQFWPKWATQRHQLGVGAAWILNGGGNEDAAWEFVKFNTRKDVMEMIGFFGERTRTTPVRRSMNNEERYSKTGPANWHVFYDTLDKRPDTGPIPAPTFSIEETNIYTRYTSLATSGEMTPKDALDGMQSELEALYARNPSYPPSN